MTYSQVVGIVGFQGTEVSRSEISEESRRSRTRGEILVSAGT